jgi:regulatory protein
MRLCSREEKCIADLKEKMDSWEISSTDQEEIIAYLKSEKYIDEQRYANYFAGDKYKFNKWGKYKIVNALKQRHIPESFINEAITAIPDKDYNQLVYNELAKKLKSLPKRSAYELKAKLYRFALSRGFESDLVLKIINDLLED